MPNTVLIGAQWGDEGKGKIVDVLTEGADLVVRMQGGNNAGHTVWHGKKKYAEIVAKGKKAKEKIRDPRGIKFKDKKGEGYMKGGKKTYA